jgi:serine/threonine-protein kinase
MDAMAEPEHEQADAVAPTQAAPLEGLRQPQATNIDEAPPLVAGRYEILGMLGAGGMGTVYRARDRELDEIVALKILRKELATSSTMLERFRREVKLARRVTHKNVARTFDIGEHGGDRFLTMELIDGDMLGAHLARSGRLSLREVVSIARDVCAGLAAAHAAGVLHRDLKPENVIVARDGRAVITDFGIARAVAAGDLGRTAGGIIGTPAYMAPEQVEGGADLDVRADLYALGTMLFELLTGKMAWPGDSAIAIAAARLLRPPPDVRSHLPELSADAAELVMKLMARNRDDRFASADAADEALAALAGAPSASVRSVVPSLMPNSLAVPARMNAPRTPRKSVAVLPILNLGLPDDDYIADTVSEDLVDLLSMVRELRVRPRGDTAHLSGPSRDVREAGRSLGVDVVVDGSVRRFDDVLRVSVRLVAVEDGFQLWARRFDRPVGRIVTVADDAAGAIARALAAELTAEARPVAADPIAQELYLRGRYLVHRGWYDVSREGQAMLREAHARAPDDTRIAGSLALAIAKTLTGDANPQIAIGEARALAEKTLERDPAQAEARVALGFVHLANSEVAGAATELKRAMRVAPNSVEALDSVGRLLVEVGKPKLGIAMLTRALAIDPAVTQARHSIARAHWLAGDRELALEVLGPVPEHARDFTPYMMMRGRFALWNRDRAQALVLREILAKTSLTVINNASIMGILELASTHVITPEIAEIISNRLGFNPRFAPRTLCFHAQLRAEVRLAIKDIEGAFADLHVGDANGMLDLNWLDHLELFEGLRDRPDFMAVRAATAARADRVIHVLEPETLTLDR